MNIQEIIANKRDNKELSKEEIDYFIYNYTKGEITDYQAAALVMCIYINGMNEREIADLTLAMINSGEKLDLSEIGMVVDKHSTGGVGDKVTLILSPIISSLGIPVAKMSGRGLGYTGGTIDKLQSIEGYKTDISIDEFKRNVKEIGISIMGQTLNLAPADKKLYALRDSISATASIPLIASSIMSKKIAAGADKIVLNVTYGCGAFMKTKEKALELADTMCKIGKLAGKETVCVITPMEQPLGKCIGNSLEVIEAIEFLKGNMQEDVKETILKIGSQMIKFAGKGDNLEVNKKAMLEEVYSGRALNKFKQLVERQGGNVQYIENIDNFPKARFILPVKALTSGVITKLDAEKVGLISMHLGAGRIKKEDSIDSSVGIELNKKVGDKVSKDDILAYIHANDEEKAYEAVKNLQNTYMID